VFFSGTKRMKISFLLVACACSLGQPTSRSEWQFTPQLPPGLELVYAGTYTEESIVPNVQFQRQYRLESLVFVLDAGARQADVAFMTALSERLPRVEAGVKETKLISVRLDLGQVDAQGRVRDSAGKNLLLPLSGPPIIETGCFLEAPQQRLMKGTLWEVNDDTRPPRTWQVAGLDAVGGVTCLKLIGQQQSLDWDRPRADQTAWRRRETVWVAPQLGVAQKVERTIERRDPARREPSQRTVVQYELQSRFVYPGRLYEDRKQEILKARKFQEDAAPLLRQPVEHRAQLEALLKKISLHVENQAPTPYRKEIFHLVSRLEHARTSGNASEPVVGDDVPRPVAAVGLGQRVPDFVVSELTGKQSIRLSRLLGRPVLVFFYNPATDNGREVVQFAKGLVQRHGDKLNVMAMAVTNDVNLAKRQQSEMQLPFAILDGHAMRLTFGADVTPRLVLLDSEGVVRAASTGWASHVAREIQEELERWLRK
jgi:peroxiredoxin